MEKENGIFSSGVLLDLQVGWKQKNGIFSSGVLLDLQAGWKLKMEYFLPVFCCIYKPDGSRKWNIFLRGVLLDLQADWNHNKYKPDGNGIKLLSTKC